MEICCCCFKFLIVFLAIEFYIVLMFWSSLSIIVTVAFVWCKYIEGMRVDVDSGKWVIITHMIWTIKSIYGYEICIYVYNRETPANSTEMSQMPYSTPMSMGRLLIESAKKHNSKRSKSVGLLWLAILTCLWLLHMFWLHKSFCSFWSEIIRKNAC